MINRALFGRHLLAVVTLLATPSLIILLLLTSGQWLAPGPALLAGLAILFLLAILLHRVMEELTKVALYGRDLSRGGQPDQPSLTTRTAMTMMGTVVQIQRAWLNERREQAAQLAFHETLFDNLPSPLFLLNSQRRVVRCNHAAEAIFGPQQPGRDLAGLLRAPDLLDAIEAVLSEGSSSEVQFSLPGPNELQFRALVNRLETAGIDGTVAVLSLHDISALKRIEQMRADFVANASHELRTPLATLLGFIETLRGPAHDDAEARDRFLAIMLEQATRMSRLIADLLTLSRIELQEFTPPTEQANVTQILERVVNAMQMAAQQKAMTIQSAMAPDLPRVQGREEELEQIFQNLVDNAIKYGREGTAIEISGDLTPPPARAPGPESMIRIRVLDHGEGIAREHLPRLTERFFRVDTARSRRLGGTGLGLAIVKHLVNRHRGLLTIDSREGEGSCFSVYLLPAK